LPASDPSLKKLQRTVDLKLLSFQTNIPLQIFSLPSKLTLQS